MFHQQLETALGARRAQTIVEHARLTDIYKAEIIQGKAFTWRRGWPEYHYYALLAQAVTRAVLPGGLWLEFGVAGGVIESRRHKHCKIAQWLAQSRYVCNGAVTWIQAGYLHRGKGKGGWIGRGSTCYSPGPLFQPLAQHLDGSSRTLSNKKDD